MEITQIVNRARRFLRAQGIAAGDAIAMGSLPGPPEMVSRLEPGDVPTIHLVGFCKLPITSRTKPELIVCHIEYDVSVEPTPENRYPFVVGFSDAQLEIAEGKQNLFDCIASCREFARVRGLSLGELVRIMREDEFSWTVIFQNGNAPTSEEAMRTNDCSAFRIDDDTGDVTLIVSSLF